MEDTDPFARASKMARTPPRTKPPDKPSASEEEIAPAEEIIEIENEESPEKQRSTKSKGSKRKNISITPEKEQATKQTKKETSQPTGMEEKFVRIVDMAADIEDMAKVRYSNTKVEIKYASEEMRNSLEELFESWVSLSTAQKQHREVLLAELNKYKKENLELKQKIELLESMGEKIDEEKLGHLLENIRNIDDVEKLVKLKWPEKSHKQAKTTTKSILSQAATKALIVNERNPKDAEMIARLSAIYPSFGKTIRRASTGKVLKLRIKEDIIEDGDEEETPEEQQILVIKLGDSTLRETIDNTKTVFNQLLNEEPENILVYVTQDIDVTTTLKILECCVYKQKINVELCAKGRGLKKRTNEERDKLKTMIVKNAEGKTYADTLKTIKTVINPEENGVTVRRIGRTKDGNIVIKLKDETPGASDEMSKAINRETKSTAEIKKESKIQILIHDLDGITDAKEIEKAIRDSTGEMGEVSVSDPNPSKNGAWTSKVLLPRKAGEKLLGERTIKLGWTSCRITERIAIPICYNCLKLGHLGNACKEKRVEYKRCYKCSSKDHEAGNCDKEPRCNECNQEGHVVNSFECPIYRQMVKDRFAKSRNRNIGNPEN